MDKSIFISVIIPVYNVEKYVRKSINSILEQTYKNYEIILIDDGSTDRSGKICDEYAYKYGNIKVYHQNNSGLSKARNTGIEKSKGNYICFLDSDDWYSNNALEEYVSLIINYKADISIINVFNTFDEKTIYLPKNTKFTYNKSEAMTQLFKNFSVFGSACNKLYKREIFNNIRFPNGQCWEDMYISLDVLMNISKIAYSKNACLYYRHREESITMSKFSRKNLDEYYAISHVSQSIRKVNRIDLWYKNNSRCLNYLMRTYIKLEDSELTDKKELMTEYKYKIYELFQSQPLIRWRFKDIKRYLYFRLSPKIYKFLAYKN